MFELNKEHDITVVTGIGPEDRCALIVDDFYENPEEVRKYAIASEKHSKQSDPELMSGLPGHRVWEEDKRIRQNLKPFFDGIRNHRDLWRSPKKIKPGSWETSWDRAAFICNVMRENNRDPGGGIPHIDSFAADGYTKEELKMTHETKKILDDKIELTATCVRIPVKVSHAESVNIEFEKPFTVKKISETLNNSPGCKVFDKRENAGYVTPVDEEGKNETFISRIREDNSKNNSLNLWIL